MGDWGGLIYLLLPVLLLLWLFSRARRQQRELFMIQDQVQVGAQVMMASGIFGEIVAIDDDGVVELEVAPGVRTRWRRQAVARVIQNEPADASDPARDDPPSPGSGTDADPPYGSG